MADGMANHSLYGVLQDMNNCSVCLEEFTNPKFLPCGHTFCLGCLDVIYSQSPFGNISCSICRKTHKVPQEGVAGFPNDHRVQQIKDANAIIKSEPRHTMHNDCSVCSNKASDLCLNCDETMCHKCSTQHEACKHFSDHAVVKMVDSVQCDHHKGKLVIRYCMSCSCLVCKVCIIYDHSDHDISLLKQDSNQPLPSCDPRVTVNKLEEEVQKNEAQYTANIQAIDRSSKDFKSAVEAQVQRLIDIIQRKKQEIMQKSDDIHEGLRDDQQKRKADSEKACNEIKKIKIDMVKVFSIYPAKGIIPEKVSLEPFKHDLEVIKLATIPAIVIQCQFISRNSLDVGEISEPETIDVDVKVKLDGPPPKSKAEMLHGSSKDSPRYPPAKERASQSPSVCDQLPESAKAMASSTKTCEKQRNQPWNTDRNQAPWDRSRASWRDSKGGDVPWGRSQGSWTNPKGGDASWGRSQGSWRDSKGGDASWGRSHGSWTNPKGGDASWGRSQGSWTNPKGGDAPFPSPQGHSHANVSRIWDLKSVRSVDVTSGAKPRRPVSNETNEHDCPERQKRSVSEKAPKFESTVKRIVSRRSEERESRNSSRSSRSTSHESDDSSSSDSSSCSDSSSTSSSDSTCTSGSSLASPNKSTKVEIIYGKDDVLSNYYSFTFEYKKKEFDSVYQAFQWRKAQDLDKKDKAEQILKTRSNREIKELCKSLDKDQSWDKVNIDLMEKLLEKKAKQLEAFNEELLKTGGKVIVNADENKFWGTGCSRQETNKRVSRNKWPGKNKLGELLIKFRRKAKYSDHASACSVDNKSSKKSSPERKRTETPEPEDMDQEETLSSVDVKSDATNNTEKIISSVKNSRGVCDNRSFRFSTKDIRTVKGEHDNLSTFYPCAIRYNGENFASVEHVYQWKKAMDLGAKSLAKEFCKQNSALDVKILSLELDKDQVWEKANMIFMGKLLRLKAKMVPEFRKELLETGDRILAHNVEDCYWGTGLDKEETLSTPKDQWPGMNIHGELLMSLRKELLDGGRISRSSYQ